MMGRALVDRARILRQTAGERVDGRTVTNETVGEWFRCRLDPVAAPESPDGIARTIDRPELLYGVRDLTGAKLDLHAGDRVEVDCKALGGLRIFSVTGDPAPLRRLRSLIGFVAQLARVAEHGPASAPPGP